MSYEPRTRGVRLRGQRRRIDAAEIFGVERVLSADFMGRFRAKISLEQVQHRPQDRQARQAKFAAFDFQPIDQDLVKERVQDDAGCFLDLVQYPIESVSGCEPADARARLA